MNRPNTNVDPDAEREVDLRSVWERIAARWWLPVLGLVLGAVIGFALALGGGKVYEAETLVAMGQPFSPNGGAPVASFLTNGRAVAEIIRSEAALEKAAKASDLRVRALRGNVTSAIVGASGPGARPTGAPLVTIKVVAAQPLKAERAADALAAEVIQRTSAPCSETSSSPSSLPPTSSTSRRSTMRSSSTRRPSDPSWPSAARRWRTSCGRCSRATRRAMTPACPTTIW